LDITQHISELNWGADHLRAHAAIAVNSAQNWMGHEWDKSGILVRAAELIRSADTLAGRANMMTLVGELDFEPVGESDDDE
jgi:hypothetical protein